jgi:6-phosphogluconate dehydrogenase
MREGRDKRHHSVSTGEIGLVGYGKMGSGLAERWRGAGVSVVVFDSDQEALRAGSAEVETTGTLEELCQRLSVPRFIWLMLPSGQATDGCIAELAELLVSDDLVVDGGNSNFRHSISNARLLLESGIRFADVGISGGIWGRLNGYGATIGASKTDIEQVNAAVEPLAAPGGAVHVGPVGTGHFAKMVHNAVEYAVLQAYGEGYGLLVQSDLGIDAIGSISAWQAACSIRSWLLGSFVAALEENPGLDGVPSRAADSGMGRWAIEEAVRLGVPTPAIASALFSRFDSQRPESPAMKAIAAIRSQVGGHQTLPIGSGG